MESSTRPGKVRSVLIISTLVAALAGFLFGYDNIVISGAIGFLTKFFRLDPVGTGWAAGCALVGCLIGSAAAGSIADRFGLKKSLYLCAFCFTLSSVGVALAPNFTQYIFWRIAGGIGIGAASIVAPMYIAEIAPRNIRGRLVVLYQFGIVFGVLAAVFINLLIQKSGDETWNLQRGWRWMFAMGVFPAILFSAMILLSKESPRWLLKVGRQAEAQRVFTAINGEESALAQVEAIHNFLEEERGGISELFVGPFRRALSIGIVLAALSQMSGITSLLSFLPEVFKSAGQNVKDSFFQSVLVSVVNVVFTVIAIWLVDQAGRKTLILVGTAMQTVALASVGFFYYSHAGVTGILIGIVLFVGGHAVGNGAVCWVVISEIFPPKVRGIAMSIATTALWISAYLANQFFPVMQKHLGSYGTFLFFSAMAAVNFVFVLAWVPETKGYALEEIGQIWLKDRKKGLAV